MRLSAFFILLFCGIAHAQPVTTTVPGLLLTAPSASGQIYNSQGASHAWTSTATPTFGAAGTLGSLTFGNATSGLATIEPATGALGTTIIQMPAINTTDVMTTNAATQTLTNKTITSASNTLTLTTAANTSGITTGDIISSTSNKIADSGLAVASFAAPMSYGYPYNFNSCLTSTSCVSSGVTSGQLYPLLNGSNVFYSSGNIPETFSSLNGIMAGYGSSTIPSQSFSGKTFSLQFVSASIATQTVTYTGNGGDTQATVASQLCAAVQANTTLVNATTGGPFICDPSPGGGAFNLQYVAPPALATPTVTSVGTGTINLNGPDNNLDGVWWLWQRRVTGYAFQAGDGLYCQISYFNSTPTYFECTNALSSSTIERNFTTLVSNVAVRQFGVSNGVALTGSDANPPYGGQGTLTIPNFSGGGALGFASDGEGAFDAQIRENTSNGVVMQLGIGNTYQMENHAGSVELWDYGITNTAFTFAEPMWLTNLGGSGTGVTRLCLTSSNQVVAGGC